MTSWLDRLRKVVLGGGASAVEWDPWRSQKEHPRPKCLSSSDVATAFVNAWLKQSRRGRPAPCLHDFRLKGLLHCLRLVETTLAWGQGGHGAYPSFSDDLADRSGRSNLRRLASRGNLSPASWSPCWVAPHAQPLTHSLSDWQTGAPRRKNYSTRGQCLGHSNAGAELGVEDGRSPSSKRTELWTMLGLVSAPSARRCCPCPLRPGSTSISPPPSVEWCLGPDHHHHHQLSVECTQSQRGTIAGPWAA